VGAFLDAVSPLWYYRKEISAGGLKLALIIIVLVLILDQGSKYLVQTRMTEEASIPIIQNFFHLTYIKNPGAAFGLLAYRTTFFIAMTLLVIGVIIYYYRQVPKEHLALRIALAMQIGGALGNMFDRLLYGKVVDFLEFKVWSYIFNFADSAIVVGACILAWFLVVGSKKEKLESPEGQQSGG
jgi:signal peptidase II